MKIENKALSDASLLNLSPKKNGAGGDFAALLKTAETKKPDAASELEAYLKKPLGERVAMSLRKQDGGVVQEGEDVFSVATGNPA